MFKITLFIISTPENVYLDKNNLIIGGLEAEILTRVVCGLILVSVFFTICLKIFGFVTSGLQNIHLEINIQNICGLETDTYHIFGEPFCKMAATKVIKMLCAGLMCIKILYLLSVPPLKMYI